MGEATYYLKANFESETKLNEVFEDIKDFIKQGQDTENFWQKHRHIEAKHFWIEFQAKYPIIFEYLGDLANGDNNNALAGNLDFGMDKEEPTKRGNILIFNAMVWHYASWDRFEDFLKKKFQAISVKWFSDERYD